jgi:signal transduction histidine kinase
LLSRLEIGVALLEYVAAKPAYWKLLHINSAAAAVLGRSEEGLFSEALGQNFPERPRKMESIYRTVLSTQRSMMLGRLRFNLEKGGPRYFVGHVFPFDRKIIAITLDDVSEFQSTRRELERALFHMREVADAGIISWRLDATCFQAKSISPEVERVLGYWPERFTTDPCFFLDRIHAEDRDILIQNCEQSLASESAQELNCRMVAASGAVKHFRTVVHAIATVPGKREYSGLMIDITAMKEAEVAAGEVTARILQAQDEERRRISRELHDSVGQYLSAAKMTLKILQNPDPFMWERRERHLSECEALLDQALREVRTVSYLLHPPLLDEVGLVSALRWLAEGFGDRSGIRVDVDVRSNFERLPMRTETALFRIAQEALTNVHRHSKSNYAAVRISTAGDTIMLEIEDHGKGMPGRIVHAVRNGSDVRGVGLRGMSERAKELRGKLDVVTSKKGTIIRATIPYSKAGGNGNDQTDRERRLPSKRNNTAAPDRPKVRAARA